MTSSEVTLLFEYVQRVDELKDIVATQLERIGNLEAIAQALADELFDADATGTLNICEPSSEATEWRVSDGTECARNNVTD